MSVLPDVVPEAPAVAERRHPETPRRPYSYTHSYTHISRSPDAGRSACTSTCKSTRDRGTGRGPLAILAILFLLTCAPAFPARGADEATSAPAGAAITEQELDVAIDATLVKPRYAWRAPREREEIENEPGILAGFLERVAEQLRRFGKWVGKKLERLVKWLRRWQFRRQFDVNRPRGLVPVRSLWMLAAILAGVLLGLVLYRVWKTRRRDATVKAAPVASLPDITDEDIVAEQLPADRWMEMAMDFIEREEWRLALRAMFLAALAHLGRSRLIRIAKHKSNRDYGRELDRRAHDRASLLTAFRTNVGILESVWYGAHAADRETVSGFRTNQDVILQTVATAPATAAPQAELSEEA